MRTAILFCVCAVVFAAHQAGAFSALPCAGFLDSYLDPFLLMPILLQLVLQEQILLYRRAPDFRLAEATVLRFTISVSFIAEVIFPWLSPRFTADGYDVFCYVAGSLFFYALMNRNVMRTRRILSQPR